MNITLSFTNDSSVIKVKFYFRNAQLSSGSSRVDRWKTERRKTFL